MINNPEINQTVWFIDKWSQRPASGTIAKIFEHDGTAYTTVATVHLGIGGTADYRLSDLYASLEAVETAMQQKSAESNQKSILSLILSASCTATVLHMQKNTQIGQPAKR